jgi:hypothetical protein
MNYSYKYLHLGVGVIWHRWLYCSSAPAGTPQHSHQLENKVVIYHAEIPCNHASQEIKRPPPFSSSRHLSVMAPSWLTESSVLTPHSSKDEAACPMGNQCGHECWLAATLLWKIKMKIKGAATSAGAFFLQEVSFFFAFVRRWHRKLGWHDGDAVDRLVRMPNLQGRQRQIKDPLATRNIPLNWKENRPCVTSEQASAPLIEMIRRLYCVLTW